LPQKFDKKNQKSSQQLRNEKKFIQKTLSTTCLKKEKVLPKSRQKSRPIPDKKFARQSVHSMFMEFSMILLISQNDRSFGPLLTVYTQTKIIYILKLVENRRIE
jgi:hypothetical protein